MFEIIVRIIIAILIIILSVTFFQKYANLVENKSDIYKVRITFFLTLIVVLISIIEPIFKKNILPPDYLNLNKPYLEPILVIDTIDDRSVKFHFSIINKGKLPANDIRFNIYSNTSYSYENQPIYNRQLGPSGRMSYTPDFFIFLHKDNRPFIVELEMFYNSIINEEKINYRSLVHYKIPKNNLKIREFDYDYKDEKKGTKPDIDLKFISTHSDNILEGPEGGFSFAFDETQQHETGISAFYSSPTKEVLYDPKIKIIIFKVKLHEKVIVLRKSFYKPGITFHNVVVGWNIPKKEYYLYIDGN